MNSFEAIERARILSKIITENDVKDEQRRKSSAEVNKTVDQSEFLPEMVNKTNDSNICDVTFTKTTGLVFKAIATGEENLRDRKASSFVGGLKRIQNSRSQGHLKAGQGDIVARS